MSHNVKSKSSLHSEGRNFQESDQNSLTKGHLKKRTEFIEIFIQMNITKLRCDFISGVYFIDILYQDS